MLAPTVLGLNLCHVPEQLGLSAASALPPGKLSPPQAVTERVVYCLLRYHLCPCTVTPKNNEFSTAEMTVSFLPKKFQKRHPFLVDFFRNI